MSHKFRNILVFYSTYVFSSLCLDPQKHIVMQSCDFEDGNLCEFVQEDELDIGIDWSYGNSINKGAVGRETGPEDAFGESFGYLFINSRSGDHNGSTTARIHGPYLNYVGDVCLSFAYCMNGKDVKTLNVNITSGDLQGKELGSQTIFRTKGHKGKRWFKEELDIILNFTDSVVVFEGTGPDDRYDLGDIAIDEFRITKGKCAHSKLMVDGLWHCDFASQTGDSFQNEICGFINDVTDNFDWEQGKIYSDSRQAASPFAGYLASRYFLFSPLKASTRYQVARIHTPNLRQFRVIHCLRFAYHMHHVDSEKLTAYVLNDNSRSDIWRYTRPLVDEWLLVEVEVSLTGHNTKIGFEAFGGGIGIDEVHLYIGKCDGTNNEGINECVSDICLNNGTCIDFIFGFECHCMNGFVGVFCEYDSMSLKKHPHLSTLVTYQTSTDDSGDVAAAASKAVDGDLKVCAKTKYEEKDTVWYIDLTRSYYVYSIKITPSELPGLLLNHTNYGTAPPFARLDEKYLTVDMQLCASEYVGMAWPAMTKYPHNPAAHTWLCMSDGRYVVLRKWAHRYNMIVLCEIEIATEDMSLSNDIAKNKHASQSTTDNTNSAGKATDIIDSTCASTHLSDFPWWAVDLSARFLIRAVRIVGKNGLQRLRIGATDVNPDDRTPTWDNVRWCNRQEVGIANNNYNNSCWERGQYLVVMSEYESQQLTLCSVQAYGYPVEEAPVDGCASNPCSNGSSCHKAAKGYICECKEGPWEGTNCDIRIDVCASKPCANGGTCLGHIDWFTCVCTTEFDEYIANHCVPDADECASSPCRNGGSCKDKLSGYTCECATGVFGINCEIYDECLSSPCLNGGLCKDKGMEYVCECTAGFSGINCETLPSVEITGYEGPIDEGQLLNLVCAVNGNADEEATFQYSWEFTPINSSSELEIAWEKSYYKRNVTMDDAGVYKCSIMNLGTPLATNVTVDVNASVVMSTQAPIQDAPTPSALTSGKVAAIGVGVSIMAVSIITVVAFVLVKKRILKLPKFTSKQKNSTKDDRFPIHPRKTKEAQLKIHSRKSTEDHYQIQPRKTKEDQLKIHSKKHRRPLSDSTKKDQGRPVENSLKKKHRRPLSDSTKKDQGTASDATKEDKGTEVQD